MRNYYCLLVFVLNRKKSYSTTAYIIVTLLETRKGPVRKVLLRLFSCVDRPMRSRRRTVRAVGNIAISVLESWCFDRGWLFKLVVLRIVPRLPLTGCEDIVERRGEEVHYGRNHEYDSPLSNCRLNWGKLRHTLLNCE